MDTKPDLAGFAWPHTPRLGCLEKALGESGSFLGHLINYCLRYIFSINSLLDFLLYLYFGFWRTSVRVPAWQNSNTKMSSFTSCQSSDRILELKPWSAKALVYFFRISVVTKADILPPVSALIVTGKAHCSFSNHRQSPLVETTLPASLL